MTYLQAAMRCGCPCHSMCCSWAEVPEGCPCPGVGLPQLQAILGVLAVVCHPQLQHGSPIAAVFRMFLPQCGSPMGCSLSKGIFWQGVSLQPWFHQRLPCALSPTIPPNMSLYFLFMGLLWCVLVISPGQFMASSYTGHPCSPLMSKPCEQQPVQVFPVGHEECPIGAYKTQKALHNSVIQKEIINATLKKKKKVFYKRFLQLVYFL